VLDTNLTGAFLCIAQAMKRMTTQRHGRIVAIGSIADHVAFRENAAYAASKFGLRGLVGVVNEEGKDRGVFATLISPGAVATELLNGISDPETAAANRAYVAKVAVPADSFARAVAFAISQPAELDINEILFRPTNQEF
jgi:NADP-dependent 3-hydroxy acid dehydrogenase YdfG